MAKVKMLVDGKPVYMVDMFFVRETRRHRGKPTSYEDVTRSEELIVGNREMAERAYIAARNTVKAYTDCYSEYFGMAGLSEVEYEEDSGLISKFPKGGNPEDYIHFFQVRTDGAIIEVESGKGKEG